MSAELHLSGRRIELSWTHEGNLPSVSEVLVANVRSIRHIPCSADYQRIFSESSQSVVKQYNAGDAYATFEITAAKNTMQRVSVGRQQCPRVYCVETSVNSPTKSSARCIK